MNSKNPFIRVGIDYFKVITKQDRFGIKQTELKRWSKSEIIQDLGKKYIDTVPRYDDFIIEPNNDRYKSRVGNLYNMYSKFPHKAKPGSWKWTKILLKHVFGDQYRQGLIYLQCLYLYPKKPLPVLALVSQDRQTGKSTFIDWLNIVFGNNMIIINPEDITSQFNGVYATKNIIAIEETLIEKSASVEKIKSLSTQKFIAVNMKHVSHFKLPFFGKIIMASNNEDKFIKVDSDEIRFFVRKLSKPNHHNHNILEDMVAEIPAFLDYLKDLPKPDFTKSRMVLTADEITNDTLSNVKEHSKSGLYHELFEYFTDYFLTDPIGKDLKEIKFTVKNIKEKFFVNDKNISFSYLKRTFLHDFKLKKPEKISRFIDLNNQNTTGMAYFLTRDQILPHESEITELTEIQTFNGLDDLPF